MKKKDEAFCKSQELSPVSKPEIISDAKPKKDKKTIETKESSDDIDGRTTRRERKDTKDKAEKDAKDKAEKDNAADDAEGRTTKRDRKVDKIEKETKPEKEIVVEKVDIKSNTAHVSDAISSRSSTPFPVSVTPKARPVENLISSAPTKRHRSKSVNSAFISPIISDNLESPTSKDDTEVCLYFFPSFLSLIL